MRGASVAVLDIKVVPEDSRDEVFGEGVLYITCDVADRGALELARKRILQDVSSAFFFALVSLHDFRSHTILLFYYYYGSGDLNGWTSWGFFL